jgi:tRNA A-37 threonylcarbamoyl transferase component Bud32
MTQDMNGDSEPARRSRRIADSIDDSLIDTDQSGRSLNNPTSQGNESEQIPESAAGAIPDGSSSIGPLSDVIFIIDNDYEVIDILGEGGMGTVYKARQRSMHGRLVAIKVIKESIGRADEEARFWRETKILSEFSHPHVLFPLRVGTHEGKPYLVTELIEGATFDQIVKQRYSEGKEVTVNEAAKWIAQAARGLQAAADKGIVHRDIKPQNLMLSSNDVVKVMDFGLARPTQGLKGREAISVPRSALGTPEYMAPEQWNDATTVGSPADIYSLGCTLYCLLAGHPPFPRAKFPSYPLMVSAHLYETPTPLASLRSDIPSEMTALINQMLAKNAVDRPQTQQEVVESLEAIRALKGERSYHPFVIQTTWSRFLAIVGTLLLVGVVTFWVAFGRPWKQSKDLSTSTPLARVTDASLRVLSPGKGGMRYPLVDEGRSREFPLPTLVEGNRFKIVATLDSPTPWYLVWFDTKGKVSLADFSLSPSAKVEFPRSKVNGDGLISVDSNDPAGTHLFLLIAGTLPEDFEVHQLEKRLSSIGMPPQDIPIEFNSILVGSKVTTSTKQPSLENYLRNIDSRLPKGLTSRWQLFLVTKANGIERTKEASKSGTIIRRGIDNNGNVHTEGTPNPRTSKGVEDTKKSPMPEFKLR